MKNIALIFLLFNCLSFPQKLTDSLEFFIDLSLKNNLNTKIEKQQNTYYLNSAIRYNNLMGDFLYSLNENYNSTLINTSDKSTRDEHYFNFKSEYILSSPLRIGLLASNNILSDSRKIEINSASISNAAFFANYSPFNKLFITPFLGYSNNRQVGENDSGMLLGFEGFIDDYDFSSTKINADVRYRDEDISPRKNTQRNFALVATSLFEENISNIAALKFYQSGKDFYYTADSATLSYFNVNNNIQTRTESGYSIEDRLNYNKIFPFLSTEIMGRINYRSIDRDTRYKLPIVTSSSAFDTKINELKLELESNSSIVTDKFTGIFRINYSERDENNIAKNYLGQPNIFFDQRDQLEKIKNNSTTRGSITFTGSYNFSPEDRFFFSLYQNKLRYDTPSAENFDTRDEVLSMVRLKYSKDLTPFFTAFINLEGTYNHVVYIYSENSSNNNVNRVIRFSSGGDYKGQNFSSLNIFEVSANYTVYDFEDINPNYRSFSFRQFNTVDSTNLTLTKRIFFSHYGYLKLSEQGDLKWAAFATKPTRYLQEIYTEPKLNYIFSPIVLSGGVRLFSLNTFTYNILEKIPESEYLSLGPVTEISVILSTSLFFRLYGYYEFITVNNSLKRTQINFTMQTMWNF